MSVSSPQPRRDRPREPSRHKKLPLHSRTIHATKDAGGLGSGHPAQSHRSTQVFRELHTPKNPKKSHTQPATGVYFDPHDFKALSSGIGLGQLVPKEGWGTAVSSHQIEQELSSAQPTNLFAAPSPQNPSPPPSTPSTIYTKAAKAAARTSQILQDVKTSVSRPQAPNPSQKQDAEVSSLNLFEPVSSKKTQTAAPLPVHRRQPLQKKALALPNPLTTSIYKITHHLTDVLLAVILFNGILFLLLYWNEGSKAFQHLITYLMSIGWLYNFCFSYGFLMLIYGIGWLFGLPSPGEKIWSRIQRAR